MRMPVQHMAPELAFAEPTLPEIPLDHSPALLTGPPPHILAPFQVDFVERGSARIVPIGSVFISCARNRPTMSGFRTGTVRCRDDLRRRRESATVLLIPPEPLDTPVQDTRPLGLQFVEDTRGRAHPRGSSRWTATSQQPPPSNPLIRAPDAVARGSSRGRFSPRAAELKLVL